MTPNAHSDKVGIASAAAPATVVIAVAVLLEVFGSKTSLVPVALFPIGPTAPVPTLRVTVMVAVAPGARVPRLQTSGLGVPHEPWLDVAETNVTAGDRGSKSETDTLVAGSGPLLVTVMT